MGTTAEVFGGAPDDAVVGPPREAAAEVLCPTPA